MKHKATAFADDLKFDTDVAVSSQDEVQEDINVVCDWSNKNTMSLSTEKCLVVHCGNNQPKHAYYFCGFLLKSVNNFRDLGVQRSSNGDYASHITSIATRVSRAAAAICRTFRLNSRELLWPAFQIYVLSTLMYCSPAWRSYLRRDIDLLKKIQRRFTKRLYGLSDKTYSEQLYQLGAFSLHNRMSYADMMFIFKSLHGQIRYPASDFGLRLSAALTKSGGVLLEQQLTKSHFGASLFNCRAPSEWNKLPLRVTSSLSILQFKQRLTKVIIAILFAMYFNVLEHQSLMIKYKNNHNFTIVLNKFD